MPWGDHFKPRGFPVDDIGALLWLRQRRKQRRQQPVAGKMRSCN